MDPIGSYFRSVGCPLFLFLPFRLLLGWTQGDPWPGCQPAVYRTGVRQSARLIDIFVIVKYSTYRAFASCRVPWLRAISTFNSENAGILLGSFVRPPDVRITRSLSLPLSAATETELHRIFVLCIAGGGGRLSRVKGWQLNVNKDHFNIVL